MDVLVAPERHEGAADGRHIEVGAGRRLEFVAGGGQPDTKFAAVAGFPRFVEVEHGGHEAGGAFGKPVEVWAVEGAVGVDGQVAFPVEEPGEGSGIDGFAQRLELLKIDALCRRCGFGMKPANAVCTDFCPKAGLVPTSDAGFAERAERPTMPSLFGEGVYFFHREEVGCDREALVCELLRDFRHLLE